MKIVSWNVNGVRARIKQGFEKTIKELEPDIVCIQEFRAREDQLPKSFLEDYQHFHSIHQKKGYAGASTFVKKGIEVLNHFDDFDGGDETGRVSIIELEDFVLVNSYSPNSGWNLEKLDQRVEWERRLTEYLRALPKPAILCGDLNVAPERPDRGVFMRPGCSFEEAVCFYDKTRMGLVDVFRLKNPKAEDYTWYGYQYKDSGKGLRLDYFLVDQSLLHRVIDVTHIHDKNLICGSDHIPIELILKEAS